MRFGKYRSSEKILHDEYFGEQPSSAYLLTVRLVLLCLMSASFVLVFCDLYGAPDGGILIPALTAAACSGFIYILASVLPSGLIYGSVAAALAGIAWVLRDKALALAPYLWDYLMKRLDSRLIKTADLMIHSAEKLASDEARVLTEQSYFYTVILIAILCSLAFTIAVRTRFHLFVPALAITFITTPAIAAEIAGYFPSYLLFLVSVFGFEAVHSSYDLDNAFVFGSLTGAYLSDIRSDRDHRKRTRMFVFGKKAASDTERYHRYSGNLIAMSVISAAVFFGAAVMIPEGTGINYKELLDKIGTIGSDALDTVGDILGVPLGKPDSRGYFSSDSFGGLSDSISLGAPSDSSRPVLEVTVSRNDIPVYLRGDIGTEYTGSSWRSIAADAQKYTNSVDKGFYPESEYQVFRRLLTASGQDPDKVIPLQMVSAKYLRSTTVVFQPLAAYELTYKDSDSYTFYGDNILRTRRGYINTFESLTLTPAMTGSALDEIVCAADRAGMYTYNYLADSTITAPDMSQEYYLTNIDAYRGFIESAYKKSDPVISEFVSRIQVTDHGLGAGSSTYYGLSRERFNAALSICDYFRENFSYSLTADNGEDMLSGFLYDTHEGHCALFATAMTLALREMGIPARYVTGYVVYPGSEPDGNGSYRHTLTERELHAWTEVYFRGVGWLPFDPTAQVPGYSELVYGQPTVTSDEGDPAHADTGTSSAAETTAPEEEEKTSSTEDTTAPTEYDPDTTTIVGTDPDTTAAPDDDEDPFSSGQNDTGEREIHPAEENLFIRILPILVLMVVVIALAVVIVLFFRNLAEAEKRTIRSFRTMPAYEACGVMYRFVLILLEKKGLVPGAEQLYDFAERVDGSIEMKGLNYFMMDVIGIFEKCEFGTPDTVTVTEDERDAVYRYTSAVYGKVMDDLSGRKRIFMKISLFL